MIHLQLPSGNNLIQIFSELILTEIYILFHKRIVGPNCRFIAPFHIHSGNKLTLLFSPSELHLNKIQNFISSINKKHSLNKNQRDALSFLIYSNNILYMFRIYKLFILRRQFTVHSVYGIYRVSTLISC